MVIFSLQLVVDLVPEHTGLRLLVSIEVYHIGILFNLSFFLFQLYLGLHRNVLKQPIHIAVGLLKGMLAHSHKLLLFFFTVFLGLRRLHICVLDIGVFKDASAFLVEFDGANWNSFLDVIVLTLIQLLILFIIFFHFDDVFLFDSTLSLRD